MNKVKENKMPGYIRLRAAALLAVIIINILIWSALRITVYADVTWPSPTDEIKAEGAVILDADTMTVLWGRNMDEQYYPASITKLMTALLVLENCSMDEEVTISADAVYNLESGATTASLSVGDVLTVEDLLYATLLKSANDAANALAYHLGGSIAEFAVMMNERAVELGCRNTNFKNPSGLTDDEHVTSAYDMALIMAACLRLPQFLEIESHDSYKMSPTAIYPGGLTVSMGHKMLRSGTSYSDDRVIAGKTGYITASGNTLATAARDEESGQTVIVVVMSDVNPYHYKDTALLLDFALDSFDRVLIEDPISDYACMERLVSDKIITGTGDNLLTDGEAYVTLPHGCGTDILETKFNYNLPDDSPELACAELEFYYEGRNVGSVYLLNDRESVLVFEGGDEEETETAEVIMTAGLIVIIAAAAGVLILIILILLKVRSVRAEARRVSELKSRRKARLDAMGMSAEEFDRIVKDRGEETRSRKKQDQS